MRNTTLEMLRNTSVANTDKYWHGDAAQTFEESQDLVVKPTPRPPSPLPVIQSTLFSSSLLLLPLPPSTHHCLHLITEYHSYHTMTMTLTKNRFKNCKVRVVLHFTFAMYFFCIFASTFLSAPFLNRARVKEMSSSFFCFF